MDLCHERLRLFNIQSKMSGPFEIYNPQQADSAMGFIRNVRVQRIRENGFFLFLNACTTGNSC